MKEMKEYEEKLKAFMEEKGIEGEHVVFPDSCHSVEDAAKAAGTSPENIVKNICLMGEGGKLIVAILKGEDRVDRSLVAEFLKLKKVKTASPAEIIEKTGYPCGGVPSFGFEATFLVDPRVLEKEYVYTGGGSLNSLLVISPQEMLRANGGIVVKIRKGE